MLNTWLFLFTFQVLVHTYHTPDTFVNQRTTYVNAVGDSRNDCRLFFDYEVIEHYSNPNPNILPFASRFETEEEQRKRMVVYANTPIDLKDTAFIDELRGFGYRKKYVKPTKFKVLNELFCQREYPDLSVMRCSPTYCDILIFRKNDKVVGIAKLDFVGCQVHFVCAQAETKNFGRADELQELKKILEVN